MDATAERMTAELADELSANNVRRLVDPRHVPWRFHHLLQIGRSPAHALHSFQFDKNNSLSIRLGAGCHAMLFGKPWVVFDMPAKKGTGKAPRNGEQWENFQKEHADKVILSASERDKAMAMVDSIRSHDLASRLLFADDVVHEAQIDWEQQGRARRSTPDARGPFHLVELKSTKDASREKFAKQALFCGYYAQLADQAAAIEHATGSRPWDVYVVAVENSAPYVTQVFQLSQRALDIGERQRIEWFRRLCLACDEQSWPGYSADIQQLDPPEWSEAMLAAAEEEQVF